MPTLSRLVSHLFNLSTNTLPPWLGLFVYHDLMKGELPLADLGTNVAPALAFVLVQWVTVPASLFPLLLIAERGMSGAAQWFKGILTGLVLSFHVPTLFALAVAVILNRLGLGFFLFVTAGLLGVSLMAQRLARSLAAERRRVEELTALNALNDDIIHNPPGGETTGELLIRHAPRFMPDADFELCLFDAERSEKRQVVVVWRDGAPQPTADAPLTPLWAWLREQRRPLLVADLAHEAPPFAWDDQEDGARPGSLLLVPLLATDPASSKGERCFGGLRLSHARRRALTAEALPSVTALANQLAAALENARLHQVALARERLERELVLARGIQTSFLPAGVPDVAGWTFAASLEPARHVSGDFYDFIPLSGDRLGVLIADVADKGMPAALYMALSRTLIRAHAPEHADNPAACLLAANDQILTDTQADSFVTVFYGIVNPATGEMQFTNADHNPPYLCRQSGVTADAAPTPLRATGMPLGILPGVELGNGCVHLTPGDYVVLYTDGVTEAQDQVHNEFGKDRLLAEITRRDGDSVQAVHRRIHEAVGKFVGDAPQFDDLTLMVMAREAQT
jgi:serine phosphatase RsbU (regulator of sigma subunit)